MSQERNLPVADDRPRSRHQSHHVCPLSVSLLMTRSERSLHHHPHCFPVRHFALRVRRWSTVVRGARRDGTGPATGRVPPSLSTPSPIWRVPGGEQHLNATGGPTSSRWGHASHTGHPVRPRPCGDFTRRLCEWGSGAWRPRHAIHRVPRHPFVPHHPRFTPLNSHLDWACCARCRVGKVLVCRVSAGYSVALLSP